MKNNKPIAIVVLVCLIIVYSILVFVVKETNIIAVSSVATALFTGIAVLWAYNSFKTQKDSLENQRENLKSQQESLNKQQESLIRQFNLSVFSESIRLLMNSTMYNQGRDYIYSNKYGKDLDTVRMVLNIPSGDPVGLDDFKKILDQDLRGKEGVPITKKEEQRLRDSYDKIRFFCMRMEYLGVLSKEDAALNLILDYYGYTIKKTYENLESLIKKTRKDPSTSELYLHYTQLYNLAKERE
ncbi:MAG: hypothetical protein K5890_12605 [Bacteroidales bacterium]|nr:hypothetical protein [Bacteroidales bacterium]